MSVELPPPGLWEQIEARLEPREEAARELVPQLLSAILQELEAIRAASTPAPSYLPNTLPPIPPTPPATTLPTAAETGGKTDNAVASPFGKRPDYAMAVANFPLVILKLPEDYTAPSGVALMAPAHYTVPATGTIGITVSLETGAPPSTLSVTLDGGVHWAVLNQGAPLQPGSLYGLAVNVAQGDIFDFEFDTQTTVQFTRVFYVPMV